MPQPDQTAPPAGAPYLLLGLTGPLGGGKTFVRDRLIARLGEAGCAVLTYSFSDQIRAELERRGLEAARDTMTIVGNDMRRQHGAGVLAERILERVLPQLPILPRPTVFIAEAIRNPGEVESFRRALDGAFVLVGVTAREDILIQRLAERGRDLDVRPGEMTATNASRWIDVERGTTQPAYGQQVFASVDLADTTLDNSGTLADLEEKVEWLATDLLARLRRSNQVR